MTTTEETACLVEAFDRRVATLRSIRESGPLIRGSRWHEMLYRELDAAMEGLQAACEQLRTCSAELEQARRALRVQEQRYLMLLELDSDAHLVTDLVGKIETSNQAAASLLNVHTIRLRGRPLSAFICLSGRADFRLQLARLQTEGRIDGWIVELQPRRRPQIWATGTAVVERGIDERTGLVHWLLHPHEPSWPDGMSDGNDQQSLPAHVPLDPSHDVDHLTQALRDTIAVLQQTRSAFRSKELGKLRKRLEAIIDVRS